MRDKIIAFVAAAMVATASAAMTGCGYSGGMYGQQAYYPQPYMNTAYNGAYRPLLASNGMMAGPVMVPGAGVSVYAGSGFDPATHMQILAQNAASRPLIVTEGGTPGVVTVPGAGEAANGHRAASNGNASAMQRAASAERVDHLAAAVGHVAARQVAQGEALTRQGAILGRIEQRLTRTATTPPALEAPTPVVTDTVVWTDRVD